jgi:hypothetical protein
MQQMEAKYAYACHCLFCVLMSHQMEAKYASLVSKGELGGLQRTPFGGAPSAELLWSAASKDVREAQDAHLFSSSMGPFYVDIFFWITCL